MKCVGFCGEHKQALEDAGLLKLIELLPNGLDTVVEENGSNLPGGERQRLSLARAFLRNRPILILDEDTSAVDAVTAADIEDGLLNDRNPTLTAVTHNVSEEHLRRFDSALVDLLQSGMTEIEGIIESCMEGSRFLTL